MPQPGSREMLLGFISLKLGLTQRSRVGGSRRLAQEGEMSVHPFLHAGMEIPR
jgi:hypothetical protein